ncbi:MAG: WGR domain-containing protein [Blastocatellia bacterium]|nr:WGR domain-containing protein [Blastocatellia bacterium]
MKLIKQTVLVYREGRSDKVYEVDLCEVGQDRYVVNFRYGRRGTQLKEGTKTTTPLPRKDAEKVFDSLVNSKTKKGYRDATGSATLAPSAPPKPRPATPTDSNARNQMILDRLADKESARRKGDKRSPVDRAIWRAGELRLRAAIPLLINLMGTDDALRDYSIAWALGLCGDGSAIEPLSRLYANPSTPDMVRRIAGEALLKLSDEETCAEFRSDMIEQVPRPLRELARSGPADDFALALADYLNEGDHRNFAVLDRLYLIDNEHVRPALLNLLRTAPLAPNYFQRMRHIFKAAEYRRDGEVFGILAYRFEKETRGYFQGQYAWDKDQVFVRAADGTIERHPKAHIKSSNAPFAYGDKTRAYLRRRVWRTLKRLGALDDPDYVKMAVGVLLPFSDVDAQPVKHSSYYDWQARQTRHVDWDEYANYLAFNHILYGNSPRYFLKDGTMTWRCRLSYTPGSPEPALREEAFPKLWEARPEGLLHLLSESECRPVHHFAVKALRACAEFCAALDIDALLMLLERPYEVTARFGFEMAKDRYQPANPDLKLVLALAGCAFEEGRRQAHRWIEEKREVFLQDSRFLTELAASAHADTRAFARELLRSSAFADEAARSLIARLIARMLTLTENEIAIANDLSETIFKCFGPQLRSVGLEVVADLLAHPMLAAQELGGNILLNHDTETRSLPEEIIRALLDSPFEQVRGVGIRLLDQLSDDDLLERESLLAALSMHALEDVRLRIRPVISRIGASGKNPNFVDRLSVLFINALLTPGVSDEIQNHLVGMLRDDLQGWMEGVSKQTVLNLIGEKSSAAKELGGMVLEARSEEWSESFRIDDLVKLSNHEIKSVRRAAWVIFERIHDRCRRASNPAGYREEMAKAVRLLDSKWEDSRNHLFAFFREKFKSEDFTPAALISICDSVIEEVRTYGRALITEHFEEEAGQEYMLKLSEHPSADLQLFVTNYLERYATGVPARLRELAPYFISVLSLVNRGRVAKDRVLAFLISEAEKSEEAARIAAEILTRQSLTLAVGDRAKMIEAMLKIRRLYPQVELPLQVRSPEVRDGV